MDLRFPPDANGEIDLLDLIVTGIEHLGERIPGQARLHRPAISNKSLTLHTQRTFDAHKVAIDIDLRFRDLKARVPLFTNDLSYVNAALVRPIVAFIKFVHNLSEVWESLTMMASAHRTLIPIYCHVDMDVADFDGSWTTFDC